MMNKILSRKPLRGIALFAVGLLPFTLSSCLDNDNEVPAPQPVSYVSFYHGAPDAPDVDLLINTQKLNQTPFKYSDYYDYLAFKPATLRIKFTEVNSQLALKEKEITFQDKKAYSVFLIDKIQDIDVLVLEDSLRAPVAGKSRVRFLNLSPDAASVDLVSTGTTTTTLFGDVAFKENVVYEDINPGIYPLQVKSTGTGEVLVPVTNIDLSANKIYTFIFRGFKTPPAGNNRALNFQLLTIGS